MGVILFLLEAEVWAISASSFYISVKCRLAFFTRRLFIIFTSLKESCAFFVRAALALACFGDSGFTGFTSAMIS